MKRRFLALVLVLAVVSAHRARAQSFGIELLNNVMPASGGMAGVSNASPQDLQSAINGNPSTITQFKGTQFGLSSAWIEPTLNLSVAEPGLPAFGVSPFSNAKSDAQGVLAGNIGVTQDFSARGLPLTIGLGLISGAGAGVDYRQVPQSNGTHANLIALDVIAGAGLDLTDTLSIGGMLAVSNATLDGPFVGITGSSSDYGLRGGIGVDYDLTPETTLGAYWKSRVAYTFENLVGFVPGQYFDAVADRPQILGLGVANRSFMDGNLLLAMDVTYLQWTETALFGAVYEDQWALQFGAQYAVNDRMRVRLGYAWNENPMRNEVGRSAGGIRPPGGADHIQYIQALFAAIPAASFHRRCDRALMCCLAWT